MGTLRKFMQNSRLFNRDPSAIHFLIHKREWIYIIASECSHKYHLETRISKFVMRLVRHVDFQGREIDGAVYWMFFIPLDLWWDGTEEEFEGELSKPRKVHYKTQWEHSQDAVYCKFLANAQEKWPTDPTPPSSMIQFLVCIQKVISEKREKFSYLNSLRIPLESRMDRGIM